MFIFALWFRFRTTQSSSQPSTWPTVPFVPPQSSCGLMPTWCVLQEPLDRKSTRLNSSHLGISYAVFCLKKELAGLVGMSASWLKVIEQGRRLPPRLPVLVKLAEFF